MLYTEYGVIEKFILEQTQELRWKYLEPKDMKNKRINNYEEPLVVEDLKAAIIKLNKTCEKMDSHINFVEDTYTTLRAPLDYFATKVNSLTGNSGKELPYIE